MNMSQSNNTGSINKLTKPTDLKQTNKLTDYTTHTCSVKLKRRGKSRPFGSLVPGSRSSSKKVWAQAWRGVILALGVYSSRRDTRSIASGLVLARNTYSRSVHCFDRS